MAGHGNLWQFKAAQGSLWQHLAAQNGLRHQWHGSSRQRMAAAAATRDNAYHDGVRQNVGDHDSSSAWYGGPRQRKGAGQRRWQLAADWGGAQQRGTTHVSCGDVRPLIIARAGGTASASTRGSLWRLAAVDGGPWQLGAVHVAACCSSRQRKAAQDGGGVDVPQLMVACASGRRPMAARDDYIDSRQCMWQLVTAGAIYSSVGRSKSPIARQHMAARGSAWQHTGNGGCTDMWQLGG